MTTIKTVLHAYRFDVSNQEQAKEYDAMCERLRAKGLKVFDTISPMNAQSRKFRDIVNSFDGGYIELDTKYLFDNQWNTPPIPGQSETGLRLMDWAESIFPNRYIREGYYLEQTSEMAQLRLNTSVCGYCGKQEPSAKGYIFCPHCLDSPHMQPTKLHLTRMLPVAMKAERAPLTEAEREHLMPLFTHAQTKAEGSRAKARTEKQRRDVIAKAAKAVETAETEKAGFLWLMDNGINIDNCIYYSHTGKFSFGWRSSVSTEVRDAILEVISEFPFPYEIKCDDGRTLEGY